MRLYEGTLKEFGEAVLRNSCIRLKPYKLDGQVLMDIQQLIPLPEAEEYETKIRAQQQEKRLAETNQHAVARKRLLVSDTKAIRN